ncbi:ferric reductase-like transmembrane domain-containing protein [Frigidibacter sp.]|uniref:ferric reductase-like transmembrane domain-containing protein n=1 Tax=Frigidibacter sp. TaxID=2586418 RepID=UPI002734A503|nr:ferric reductase-like transmembrane domain-containing protein [Frigidibacter sp.]MDP3339303.1 ferric reductase-like transmembrane domain-containing protein [Frigidibacter sp.]
MSPEHSRIRAIAIWSGLIAAVGIPLAAAATSPLLAWRDPVYILAAFFGVVGLALLLLQPLLIAGALPNVPRVTSRRLHRLTGVCLVAAVTLHVGGLWITSPPDMIDALLFASPTLFSVWGVVAMWAVIFTALLAARRRHLGWRRWRYAHVALSVIVVAGTIAHALPIEGTMGQRSKIALCLLVGLATLAALAKHVWPIRRSAPARS